MDEELKYYEKEFNLHMVPIYMDTVEKILEHSLGDFELYILKTHLILEKQMISFIAKMLGIKEQRVRQ